MRMIILSIFWMGICSFGATLVELSGNTYSTDGSPLAGVEVSLEGTECTDSSDQQGAWLLQSGSTSVWNRRDLIVQAGFDGKRVWLQLEHEALVRIDVFDAKGMSKGFVLQKRLDVGFHSLELGRSVDFVTSKYIRLSVNGNTLVLNSRTGSPATKATLPKALALLAETSDELSFSYQGQQAGSLILENLQQSGLQVWIAAYGITGKILPDAAVDIDSVVVWTRLATEVRRLQLDYDKTNDGYAGMIYALEPQGAAKDYELWIDVYGNGGLKTGISDTVRFTSDIYTPAIAAFSAGNARPSGIVTGVKSGTTQSALEFGYLLDRADETIARVEWNMGDGKGFIAGTATRSMTFTTAGNYQIQLRLVDEDGNSNVLLHDIAITNSAANIAGLTDTTITPSDELSFALKVDDPDGISKVLWNFGDGSLEQESSINSGATRISHVYPDISAVPTGSKDYTLQVTVIDLLGEETKGSAVITVTNDLPSVVVENTRGGVGETIVLHAQASDLGSIAQVEWNIDGSGFQVGPSDYSVQLPAVATLNYAVQIRVTDEDGNSLTEDVPVIAGNLFTDARDGQRYRYVEYDDGTSLHMTWMAQNLNYSGDNGMGHRTYTKGWCYGVDTTNHNDTTTCENGYGRLYNWSDALSIDKTYMDKNASEEYKLEKWQGLCPDGWRIPTSSEWNDLRQYARSQGSDYLYEGSYLKAVVPGNKSWSDPAYNAGDPLGFSALPNGRAYGQSWWPRSASAYFWTASENKSTSAYDTDLYDNFAEMQGEGLPKSFALSVRCIGNEVPIAEILTRPAPVATGQPVTIEALTAGTWETPEYSVWWRYDGGSWIQSATQDGHIQINSVAAGFTHSLELKVIAGAKESLDTVYFQAYQTFIDARDGQEYRYVTYLGYYNKTWMAQNLNYSGDDDAGHRTYTKGWCYGVGDKDTTQHQDSVTCGEGNGRLYNWTDAMRIDRSYLNSAAGLTGDFRGICPEGWHIPSTEEWSDLENYVHDYLNASVGALADDYLKATVFGYDSWNNKAYNAGDPIGFSALPAGIHIHFTGHYALGRKYDAVFWAANEMGASDADNFELGDSWGLSVSTNKSNGFSVRCIMD